MLIRQSYADNAGNPGPKMGYGLQDLNYYGNYFMAPGYGYAWQPFGFANSMTGFDPYSMGAWLFAPGLGYSFASQYPWGWLPYHYGSWAFLGGGVGWAWLPGGNYGSGWSGNRISYRSGCGESACRVDGGDAAGCYLGRVREANYVGRESQLGRIHRGWTHRTGV